ncbi:kelch-like protein 10, partial [Zootermopsis nevadensis]|uniref:kelch-like protein 10 n=1 Tax=Zootermopsis nevadensis TaxID=136037 RepID=UPI000B8ED181
MHEGRRSLSVAVLRGAVYAMGGFYGGLHLSTAERYDCETDQWSLIAPMNTGREDASAAVLNNKIYVAGGRHDKNFLNSVEVYDTDIDQWTFVAPMLSGRGRFSCVEFLGCLYAVGGHNKTSDDLSTEKYDLAEDKWTEIPGMVVQSSCIKVEVIDDKIFVIGGSYNQGSACVDDKEIRWYQAPEMKFDRYCPSTCVIKNLPNASDYTYKLRDKLMKKKRKRRRRK